MKKIIFFAPYCGANTLRFVYPVRELPEEIYLIGLGQETDENVRRLGNLFDEYHHVDNYKDMQQMDEALGAIVKKHTQIDALLNIFEEPQQMLSEFRAKYNIPGLLPEIVRRFRDKAYMKDVLRKNKVLCSNYKRIDTIEDAQKFTKKYGFPVVVKPLGGAGAVNTFVVHRPEQLQPYLEKMKLSPEKPAIMEEFIEGDEGSFDTLTLNGKIVFYSMTTYFPGPMDAMLNPWVQIIFSLNKDFIDHPDYEDVRKTGQAAIKALGLGTAMTHMEWFRRKSDGKIYVGEIAARPPGDPIPGLHNYAHDISLYEAWAKLMVLGQYDLKPERKYHVACARLRAQGPGGQIREIHGLDLVQREVGHLIVGHQIAPIGVPKTDSYMGESFIYCRGENYEEVFDAARFITENVRILCW